jgi:hypothetical protein
MGRRVLLALALLVGALPGSVGAASETYPAVAGTTVITTSGDGATILSVPRTLTFESHRTLIESEGPVFVGLGAPRVDGRCQPLLNLEVNCIQFLLFRPPDSRAPNVDLGLDPREIGWDRLEVYVLAERPARVTLHFRGVEGATAVNATGGLSGVLQELPKTCPSGECKQIAYGGASHDLSSLGQLLRYAIAEGEYGLGSSSIGSCHYTSERGAEPDDHPYGCDAISEPDHLISTLGDDASYVVNAALPHGLYATASREWVPPGRHYIGFRGHRVAYGEGYVAGYGIWIEQGIVCPSGDYAAC